MSSPSSCCSPCADVETVEIPGVQGDAGTNGTDGEDGVNAFTMLTAGFNVPNVGSDEDIFVADNQWMVIGQIIFIENAGFYEVLSKTGTTGANVENLGYTVNTAPAVAIPSGGGVSPGGSQPSIAGLASDGVNSDITELTGLTTPLSVAQGGTGLTAPVEPLATYAAGTGYVYTATAAALNFVTTDPVVTIVEDGLYMLIARVRTDIGVLTTISAARTLTLKLRNTTTATDIPDSSCGALLPQIGPALNQTVDQRTLPVVFAQLVAGDVITIYGNLDSMTGVAGDVYAFDADIEAVWLHA